MTCGVDLSTKTFTPLNFTDLKSALYMDIPVVAAPTDPTIVVTTTEQPTGDGPSCASPTAILIGSELCLE